MDYNDILRGISVSISGVPYLVKTIGYRLPLKERSNSKYLKVTLDGSKQPVDFTGFLVIMDYYKNGDVEKHTNNYLKSNGMNSIMNPTIRSKIIFGIASIMKCMHHKNIIFRDLKLDNVYLNDELEPVIGDFELSRFYINSLEMTMAIGTPLCMAPEIFMDGDETYSLSVDVYSFAFCVYKMFTLKVTFSDLKPIRSSQHFMRKISQEQRPVRPKSIPDCYWELIQKCWKQNPDERPTFDEITEMLKDDKFAIEEFGMKTDIDELHKYRAKFEIYGI